MGKLQFLMDTGGHCFLCLKLTGQASWALPPTAASSCQTGDDIGGETTLFVEGENIPKIVSFGNICKYLHLNVKEICQEAMPISAGSLMTILESSELKGVLCPECSDLLERFSKNLVDLDGIKMKVQFCLKTIYDMMASVDKNDDGRDKVEFEREMVIRQQTALKNAFVEQLRRKMMERCSTVAETGLPQVLVKNLEPEAAMTKTYFEPEVITIEDDDEEVEEVDQVELQEIINISPVASVSPQQMALNLDDPGLQSLSGNHIRVVRVEEESEIDNIGVEVGTGMTGSCTSLPQSQTIDNRTTMPPPISLPLVDHSYSISHGPISTNCCGKQFHSKRREMRKHLHAVHAVSNGCDAAPQAEDPTSFILERTDLISNAGTGDDNTMDYEVCPEKVSDSATHKYAHFKNQLRMSDKEDAKGGQPVPKLLHLTVSGLKFPSRKPRTLHQNVKYKCSLCGKEFYYRGNCYRHQRSVHMGIRFKCDLCEKMFTQKAMLLEHREKVHFGTANIVVMVLDDEDDDEGASQNN